MNSGCRFAHFDADEARHKCEETGDNCIILIPDEKLCYEMYKEGPIAFDEYEKEKKSKEDAK